LWHESYTNSQLRADKQRPLWKLTVYKNGSYVSKWGRREEEEEEVAPGMTRGKDYRAW
jgi:hypothetical protein